MNRLKNTRSSLFLIELMIAVLFFSLGSAICVQAFAKAYMANRTAKHLSFASSSVSSAASVIKYTEKNLADLQNYYPYIEKKGEEFLVFYDDTFKECTEKNKAYTLHIETTQTGQAETSHISMIWEEKEELLYELNLCYPAFANSSKTTAKEDAHEE